jgi:hypothetical protein
MTSKVIDGYTYSLSTNKNKKLKVIVGSKTIHFGDTRYEHFFDKTGLLPKSQNHGDEKRRQAYLNRASKIKDSTGLAMNNPKSANYHAVRILWNGP